MKRNYSNIIVVGYPKSGNTWLTRLVSELASAPIIGGWNKRFKRMELYDSNDSWSNSPWRVFKSHSYWQYLSTTTDCKKDRLILVVRDVRAVAASAASYFSRLPNTFIEKKICNIHPITYMIYRRLFLSREKISTDDVIQVLVHGNKFAWCRTSWDDYTNKFLDNNCFFIRYEDMHTQPIKECQRILNHLGIYRSIQHIELAVEKHNFNNVKKRAVDNGNKRLINFLRRGSCDAWKEELTPSQICILTNRFVPTLKKLKYI